jgi:hypothetical protein
LGDPLYDCPGLQSDGKIYVGVESESSDAVLAVQNDEFDSYIA